MERILPAAILKAIFKMLRIGVLMLLMVSCSSTSLQRSGQGALAGGAAGAVGGMFTAIIFGGDVGDAAARGAVWGASTGAVSGAIQGSAEHKEIQRQQQAEHEAQIAAELARIKAEIGEDAYDGLEALTVGKHEVALAYARTAARSADRDYAIAGLWLEALIDLDQQREAQVAEMIPTLVARDPTVSDNQTARQTLAELLQGLADIRTEFGVVTG